MSFREALPLSSLAMYFVAYSCAAKWLMSGWKSTLLRCESASDPRAASASTRCTCTRAQAGGVGKRGLGRAGGLGAGGVAAHAIANVLLFERERPARLLRRHELLV